MNNKKKYIVLTIISVFAFILITSGVTYAFFSYIGEGSTENTIEAGSINFIYEEVNKMGNGISMTDALPISDGEGKESNNYFDFKVTSSSGNTQSIPYEITARVTEGSYDLSDYVKIYLTKVNGTNEQEKVLSIYSDLNDSTNPLASRFNDKTLYTDEIPVGAVNYTDNYRLRMWLNNDSNDGSVLDYSPVYVCSNTTYTNQTDCESNNGVWNPTEQYETQGKTFSIKINVYANGEQASQQKIATASSTGISNLEVNGSSASENSNTSLNYDFYKKVNDDVTEAEIEVETDNPKATVTIENITDQAMNTNIKRLSTVKLFNLKKGDNFFKITVTSENRQHTDEYILKVEVATEAYDVTMSGTKVTFSKPKVNIEYGSSNTVRVTPASGYYISSGSCTNDYTITNLTTGTNATSQQTITISSGNVKDNATCTIVAEKITYADSSEIDEAIPTTTSKSVIACDKDSNDRYDNCNTYSTIQAAVASRTDGIVVLTKALSTADEINIGSTQAMTIDFNGYTLSTTGEYGFTNDGVLVLQSSQSTGGIVASKRLLTNRSNTTIQSGVYVGSASTYEMINNSSTCSSCIMTVNGGTFTNSSVEPLKNSADSGTITINDGTFNSTGSSKGTISNAGAGTININGGAFDATGTAVGTVTNESNGNINITGGIIYSQRGVPILNDSSGTLYITQSTQPIYIKSSALPSAVSNYNKSSAISNTKAGTIRIIANRSSDCTNNSPNTNGLCVIALGDGGNGAGGNTAVFNGSTGKIYINGGTYIGGAGGIRNASSGTINVLDALTTSGLRAIVNAGSGKFYICSSSIEGNEYDLYNLQASTGTIRYNSSTKFTSGDNNPTKSAGSGTISGGYTGTCQ